MSAAEMLSSSQFVLRRKAQLAQDKKKSKDDVELDESMARHPAGKNLPPETNKT